LVYYRPILKLCDLLATISVPESLMSILTKKLSLGAWSSRPWLHHLLTSL